ncbi:hypothetical protein IEQ34_021894 [Dendrobium chrysotoxum]|uniref:Uncharacterized protein n=1 Tax=Dendrobium chrysotoxum TaxID=161865 RepID=A0AAV7FJY1_DENCH|nr:hypothetical protein IEQ34_021894 [Dendrobium chrysotoxum]
MGWSRSDHEGWVMQTLALVGVEMYAFGIGHAGAGVANIDGSHGDKNNNENEVFCTRKSKDHGEGDDYVDEEVEEEDEEEEKAVMPSFELHRFPPGEDEDIVEHIGVSITILKPALGSRLASFSSYDNVFKFFFLQ